MDKTEVIKHICLCLKLLGNSDKSDLVLPFVNKVKKVEAALEANIIAVKKEIESNTYLKSQISLYIDLTADSGTIGWIFVELSLTLLIVLKKTLQLNYIPQGHTGYVEESRQLIGNSLSIEQQNVVLKILQFIIGLGIIPNLLPGVRSVSQKKTEISDLVECIQCGVSPWKKHCRLVACVTYLIFCCKETSLGSLILSCHLQDLLASLLQLCYAPIKKVDFNEEKYSKHSSQLNPFCVEAEKGVKATSKEEACGFTVDEQYYLTAVMKRVNEHSEELEHQVITQMWEDRKFLTNEFNELTQKIYRPLFVQQLILLIGTSTQSFKESEKLCHKSPLWLKKVCSQMLTDCLLQHNGVLVVVQGIYEMSLDPKKISSQKDDINACDWKKCESVAKLIARVPAKLPCVEQYYKQIFPQIMKLVHTNDSAAGNFFLRMACCILSNMLGDHPYTTRVVAFGCLFKPLLNYLHQLEMPSGGKEKVEVKKDEVETCIADLHKIFICGITLSLPLIQELVTVYFPLFHLLTNMDDGLLGTRSKILDLIVALHRNCDKDTTVSLLNMALFEDRDLGQMDTLAMKIALIPSNIGTLGNHLPPNSGNLFMKIEKKCQVLEAILDAVNSDEVKSTFVISLLKRITSCFSNLNTEGKNVEPTMETQTNQLHEKLLLLKLLYSFSEGMEQILIQNKSEAVNFIKEILSYRVEICKRNNFEIEEFGEKILVISLNALGILISEKSQAVSSDWIILEQCVPNLDCLVSFHPDSHIRSLAEDLKIAIASRCPSRVSTFHKNLKKPPTLQTNMLSTHYGKLVDVDIKRDTVKEELHEVQNNFVTSQTEENKATELLKCSASDDPTYVPETLKSTLEKDPVSYQSVLQDLQDPLLPVRGHALMALNHLILKRDPETLLHREDVLKVFQDNLEDSDTYIYLPAIQGLASLGSTCTDYSLPLLCKCLISTSNYSPEVRVKLGEALLKISQKLGDMIPKYRDLLINTFLICSKDPCPQVRASSLSNLGEVCKHLKFGLGPFLQEILLCVSSLIKTDQAVEVRRASALLITLLLQGVGIGVFKLMESQMKDLYHLLKLVYSMEKDDVVRLHTQLAMEEINNIIQRFFTPNCALVKHINVLHPL